MGQGEREGTKVGQGQRVHDCRAVVECELHDHEARCVGALGVELRVQADAIGFGDARAKIRERGRFDDELRFVHGAGVAVG